MRKKLVSWGGFIDPALSAVDMARSKQLHYVNLTVDLQQPDEPGDDWAVGVLQVDELLSQKFGRTIRNGNQFRLVGYGSSLRGYDSSADVDSGFAGVTTVRYCPVTANSVGAHQSMYKAWLAQKKLSSAVGEYVRYDDFEVGWDATYPLSGARKSQIKMGGLSDTTFEEIVIYGPSAGGVTVALENFYDNLNPIAAPSEDYVGSVIKDAKFIDKFPDFVELSMPTSFSSNVAVESTPDALSGAVATGQVQWLPSDNHLSHMTGTLLYYFKGIPGDTGSQIADELRLTLTLVYEGWSSIAPKARRSSASKKATTKAAPPSKK